MQLSAEITNFWDEEIGHLSEEQARYILNKVDNINMQNVLEIGFAGGRHTYAILKSFDVNTMVSVDINFDYQNGRHKIKKIQDEFNKATFIEGDSKKVINKDFIDQYFKDGIDYAFVDGGHSYDDAISDMRNVYKYLSSGGIMIVDDYKSKVCPLSTVDRAVEDFAKENNIEFEVVALEDGKGMAVFLS